MAEKPLRQNCRAYAEAACDRRCPQNRFRSPFGGGGDPAHILEEILRRRSAGGFSSAGFATHGRALRFALEVPFPDAARGATLRLTLGAGSEIPVSIPQGAEKGQTLRLRGRGGPGPGGGPPDDALITRSQRPHPALRRDGTDILMTLPITIDEAGLGGKVAAPTFTGPVNPIMPPGASSGRIPRLRGRGVAKADGMGIDDRLVALRTAAWPAIDAPLREFPTEWRKTHSRELRTALLPGPVR